jgi:hypothetical protein
VTSSVTESAKVVHGHVLEVVNNVRKRSHVLGAQLSDSVIVLELHNLAWCAKNNLITTNKISLATDNPTQLWLIEKGPDYLEFNLKIRSLRYELKYVKIILVCI